MSVNFDHLVSDWLSREATVSPCFVVFPLTTFGDKLNNSTKSYQDLEVRVQSWLILFN